MISASNLLGRGGMYRCMYDEGGGGGMCVRWGKEKVCVYDEGGGGCMCVKHSNMIIMEHMVNIMEHMVNIMEHMVNTMEHMVNIMEHMVSITPPTTNLLNHLYTPRQPQHIIPTPPPQQTPAYVGSTFASGSRCWSIVISMKNSSALRRNRGALAAISSALRLTRSTPASM